MGDRFQTAQEAKVSNRINHQDIVKKALDSKAVDFAAIGKLIAELGPSVSLADEPWEGFCGTMRFFIRILIVNPNPGGTVENLGALRGATGELQS
jgi:hypothetical protein